MKACLSLLHGGPFATPTRAGRPVRVLLVEDDRDLRSALAELLRFERIEVAEAENGLEALLHLRSATPAPDVVLLDLAMPIMNGWEFRAAQLRDPTIAGVPVVLLTSQQGDGLEAEAVLTKPCPPEQLLATIARVARAAAR